jgi:hypothetical protein
MTNLTAKAQEHLARYRQPDGLCLYCGRAANHHYPVGPITITICEPDDSGNGETDTHEHEFCRWECLAEWAAVQAGGDFVVSEPAEDLGDDQRSQ